MGNNILYGFNKGKLSYLIVLKALFMDIAMNFKLNFEFLSPLPPKIKKGGGY